MSETAERYLSQRFTDALSLAAELHAGQKRKKESVAIPYIAHLMSVSALVLEDAGTEDEAIAALLHDAVEDQGLTPGRLIEQFGPEVTRIVLACSDAAGPPGATKPPWLERKLTHLAHLRHLGDDVPVLRVTAADKLHNCRDIVLDVESEGPQRMARFNGGVQGTCWYYGEMVGLLTANLPGSRLTPLLDASARRLHELAGVEFPAARPRPPG